MVDAQVAIARMYYKGEGYLEVYYWNYLSHLNGYEGVGKVLDILESKGFLNCFMKGSYTLLKEDIKDARRKATRIYEEQRKK